MTETELLKQEIKMLQSKLEFLEELEKTKSPVEKAFKRVYGTYSDSYDTSVFWTESDEDTWISFQKGYTSAKENYKVGEYEPTPQEPEEVDDTLSVIMKITNAYPKQKSPIEEAYAEGLRNAMRQAKKDGVFDEPTKPMDEVVDRLVKKYQAQKLWNRVRDELGYSIDLCDEIVDLVEDWILDEQSASGSQNIDVEFLVEGFNDCVRKMKEMLR